MTTPRLSDVGLRRRHRSRCDAAKAYPFDVCGQQLMLAERLLFSQAPQAVMHRDRRYFALCHGHTELIEAGHDVANRI